MVQGARICGLPCVNHNLNVKRTLRMMSIQLLEEKSRRWNVLRHDPVRFFHELWGVQLLFCLLLEICETMRAFAGPSGFGPSEAPFAFGCRSEPGGVLSLKSVSIATGKWMEIA